MKWKSTKPDTIEADHPPVQRPDRTGHMEEADEPAAGRIADEIEREVAESHRRVATGQYDLTAIRNLYRDSKRELQEEGERMMRALREWHGVTPEEAGTGNT